MNRVLAVAVAGFALMVAFIAIALALLGGGDAAASCETGGRALVVGPAGSGTQVGATVFADRRGYRGDDLAAKPDSYAELGGRRASSANLLGGLPYMTALRITANGRSVIAFKRDFGFGQGSRTIEGKRFAIDLYIDVARALGFGANWSGIVRVERAASDDTAPPAEGHSTDACLGTGRFLWPVSPHPVSSLFCEARSWEACHPGVDFAVAMGTPIRAADGGRITHAGAAGGYGNYTCIEHTARLSSCYGHQSRIDVRVGQIVARGQLIGAVGSTGHSTGPHLHFEARVSGRPRCPATFLGAKPQGLCVAGSPGT